jgi:septal ring factor EnvC (AmiA/AmiB activator)
MASDDTTSASQAATSDVLKKQVVYDGEGYTRQSIEQMLTDYQGKQTLSLKKFEELSGAYQRLSKEMTVDIADQKSATEYLSNLFTLKDVKTNIQGLIYKMPLVGQFAPSRDLKQLLGEKVEIAQRRVQEVGNYLDVLQGDVKSLQDDIGRLNKKMVTAAQNRERAAAYVLELEKQRQVLEDQLKAVADPKSAQGRTLSAQINEVKSVIWEHGAKLRLFTNAADRLSAVIGMNNNFLEIMTNLDSNMSQLYEAGNEVLNELQGNLAGLSSISKAGELSVEMHKSMESLKESVNKLAVLASDTSLYLTQNIDRLTSDMKVYDKATEDMVAGNLAAEREIKEHRINETIELARKNYASPAGGDA